MRGSGRVSVVLPAHNEAGNLATVVASLRDALPEEDVEIIIVDDGSTDGTWQTILDIAKRADVRGLRLSRNFGQQAAILAGLEAARGDAVITMDADGQHPPEVISSLLAAWRGGARIVQALRLDSEDTPVLKKLTSHCFYWVLSRLAAVRIEAGSSDFRLLDRRTVDIIRRHAGPIPFLRGMLPWLALPTETIRYQAKARLSGDTSYPLGRMVRLSLDGILSFSTVPLRLATAIGGFVSALAFAYLVYVAVIRFTSGEAVPGWASTAGLLSLLGGFQLLTLGILGEYLGRLFIGSLGRPLFVVADETETAESERT